jgi:hypothetical protein
LKWADGLRVAGGNNCGVFGFLIVFGARAGKSEAKRWPVGGEKGEGETGGVVAPRARLSWRRTRSAATAALRLGAADAELVGGSLTSFPWFIARFFSFI